MSVSRCHDTYQGVLILALRHLFMSSLIVLGGTSLAKWKANESVLLLHGTEFFASCTHCCMHFFANCCVFPMCFWFVVRQVAWWTPVRCLHFPLRAHFILSLQLQSLLTKLREISPSLSLVVGSATMFCACTTHMLIVIVERSSVKDTNPKPL